MIVGVFDQYNALLLNLFFCTHWEQFPSPWQIPQTLPPMFENINLQGIIVSAYQLCKPKRWIGSSLTFFSNATICLWNLALKSSKRCSKFLSIELIALVVSFNSLAVSVSKLATWHILVVSLVPAKFFQQPNSRRGWVYFEFDSFFEELQFVREGVKWWGTVTLYPEVDHSVSLHIWRNNCLESLQSKTVLTNEITPRKSHHGHDHHYLV